MSAFIRQAPALAEPPPGGDRQYRAMPTVRALETAAGLCFGPVDPADPAPVVAGVGSVAAELDAVMRRALVRPPAVFSFSGGRDSSALLARAVQLARREALDLPIPATLLIPGDSDAEESEWQDHVLRHLGITERIVITVGSELDCVGPVAGAALLRHGAFWPCNLHMHAPIIAAAQGGSVVTGVGGDELGRSSQNALAAQVLSRRRRPNRTDPAIVGLALSPPPVRRAVFRRRRAASLATLPWLTPAARKQLAHRQGGLMAEVPLDWRRVLLDWWPGERYFQVTRESFDVLAEPWNVQMIHPFDEPRVLAALARLGGFGGLGSRTRLMHTIFGDVLPEEILFRQSKAVFSNVTFADHARRFARNWSGGGVDPALVDPVILRRLWTADPLPDMRTMNLLQAAWLHDQVAN